MSRRTLILCLSAIAVLVLGTGAAVAILYSGAGDGVKKEVKLSGEGKHSLLKAVPSDAVLVGCFSSARKAGISPGGAILPDVPLTVSMHFTGRLIPLYVLDMHKSSEDIGTVVSDAREKGLFAASEGSMVMISESETLLRSSLRHIDTEVSVIETQGFADALEMAGSRDALFVSNLHSGRILSEVFHRKFSSRFRFFESLADWTVVYPEASDEKGLHMKGLVLHGENPSEYMNVLESSAPSVSSVADVLPSYTLFAATLPLKDVRQHITAFHAYLDSSQELQRSQARQDALKSECGLRPDDFFTILDVSEIATAVFMVNSRMEQVNLMKVGNKDVDIIFKGTDIKSFKQYKPFVHANPYPSFASSSFGNLFSLEDESCFTYVDGWIVTGSRDAVDEYAQGKTLSYTLREYMKNAGNGNVISASASSFAAYFSFSEAGDKLEGILKPDARSFLARYHEGCDTAPLELYVVPSKGGAELDFRISRLELARTKAPEFERDTLVTVPKGPFKVKNSHTGKMNLFYQNSHNTLCLQDEKGKDLWGVPFKLPLCGTVHEVDYYANGKLQYAFGAGSKVYLIDRLSRFVNGFPIDLGKEILIGPDVYDFNGTKAYNIMVLHKDNTIQMYNLKGQKPSSWKGMTSEYTIKGLPERIVVGGNGFWVVRTSVETLIFPFYGGESLVSLEGDRKIRPDSEIAVTDAFSISASCYDGRQRTFKLK